MELEPYMVWVQIETMQDGKWKVAPRGFLYIRNVAASNQHHAIKEAFDLVSKEAGARPINVEQWQARRIRISGHSDYELKLTKKTQKA